MAKRVYKGKNANLSTLCLDFETWFTNQNYQVESQQSNGIWMIQAKKNEGWRKAIGASRAFKILIEGDPNYFTIETGVGEWATNLTAGGVAAVLTGGASLLVSGITVGWTKKIEFDFWGYVEERINFGVKELGIQEKSELLKQEELAKKLEKLKEAFAAGIIDEHDYKIKKEQIENEHKQNSVETEVNQKLLKLKEALDMGILSQDEFQSKKAELLNSSKQSDLEEKLSKLKLALENNILTLEEFEQKKKALELRFQKEDKIKKLEEALQSGIITEEEFNKKKEAILV